MRMNNDNGNQSTSDEISSRRTKKRRWDAIIVGIAFSLAFVLLISKVAHMTPCEAINHFGIETKTCMIVSNNNSFKAQLANQHGLGFAIIVQYALLGTELSEELIGQVQQFLQNIGL